jgi:hypothetical protein
MNDNKNTDDDPKARKIATAIREHSQRESLLYLCFLADTIEGALGPLTTYAQCTGDSLRVVRSKSEILHAMAARRHVVVDITSGLPWLPSKVILDARWGDRLLHDTSGNVFGSKAAREPTAEENVNYHVTIVPKEFYLHFFSDGPFNPPSYFAERIAGRVLDFREDRKRPSRMTT